MSKKHFTDTTWPVALLMSFMLISSTTSQAQREPAPAQKEILPEMPANVYDKVSPVTVRIDCNQGEKNGTGSIVGITPQRRALILTACHVVARNFEEAKADPDLPLEFYNDMRVKILAEVTYVKVAVIARYVDRANDLALIVTAAPVSEDRVINYTLGEEIKSGQIVAAFGYPRTDELSQTVGRITRIQTPYLIFDAQIAPGSSGGPLIDQTGRMIGLSTSTVQGEGYALQINLVAPIVNGWLQGLKLKNTWQYEKNKALWQDWRFIAGGAVAVGVAATAIIASGGPTERQDLPGPPALP